MLDVDERALYSAADMGAAVGDGSGRRGVARDAGLSPVGDTLAQARHAASCIGVIPHQSAAEALNRFPNVISGASVRFCVAATAA
jgi:hypothetical protein